MDMNWHQKSRASRGVGAQLADKIALALGSWEFIIIQTIFILAWIGLNIVGIVRHWDAYPFILLNLLFSTQAAYAAPIIIMSQNRAADRDRHQAEADYKTNRKAEREIEDLHMRLARIENEKLDKIIKLLEKRR